LAPHPSLRLRQLAPNSAIFPAMTDFKADPRIVLDLARDRLRIQLSFYDVLDSKVATLFAAGSALLGLLIAVLAIRFETVGRGGIVILVVASMAYVLLVAAAAVTHWPHDWCIGPSLDEVWRDAQVKPDDELIAELISDYATYFGLNLGPGRLKSVSLRVALLALLAETATLVSGLAFLAR
jgi:hypothetical protein